ncbi:hypothetical protein H072_3446 [Dactylellina haptotyla CBS 200.50]|uniref:Uncharacterized protein n=1 Tax=Dactylellina haptotyla (strain CBS 200.50) TaxID=1284197 RepID=S8AI55_DACHA|nr:hypothetical protein H072_3446 [Dactylellina haptotyla CBS 200.50]
MPPQTVDTIKPVVSLADEELVVGVGDPVLLAPLLAVEDGGSVRGTWELMFVLKVAWDEANSKVDEPLTSKTEVQPNGPSSGILAKPLVIARTTGEPSVITPA